MAPYGQISAYIEGEEDFDNPVSAIISRSDYVQRKEPRSSGHDPG